MSEFKKWFIIVSCAFVWSVFVYCIVAEDKIVISKSLVKQYKEIYNLSIENFDKISPVDLVSDLKILIAFKKFGNNTLIDIRSYTSRWMFPNVHNYYPTEDGLFFTLENYITKAIQNFIFNNEKSTILISREGYLFLDRFAVEDEYYLYLKIRKRGVLSYRGILLTFDNTKLLLKNTCNIKENTMNSAY